MISRTKAPAGGDPGGASGSVLLGSNTPGNKPPEANTQACPIATAMQCRLTSDLLAESVEIAQVFCTQISFAVRVADDESILKHTRGFLAAARTVWLCAKDLRALHKARGGQ